MTKDGVETCGLVPFLNYFNFNNDRQTFTTYDQERNAFVLVAREHIPRGTEVSMRAPMPHNDYFLLKRGCIHPGRETRIPVIVRLNEADPFYSEKL
jgi:hypothetical protein